MKQWLSQANGAAVPGVELLGEWRRLLEQLGPPAGLVPPGTACWAELAVESAAGLARFLDGYQARLLWPIELPLICQAARHARRHEIRELIALDRQIARSPLPESFARASETVGRRHLEGLHPLRDQRLVQRYREAVAEGEAQGWHTLVYGVSLAVYSVPLRQGLASYAEQSLNGFIRAASRPLALSPDDQRGVLEAACAGWPSRLQQLLAAESPGLAGLIPD